MLAAYIYTACDSENKDDSFVIWDICPIEYNIFISDSKGNDLLDSTYQNNIIKEVSVSYEGEDFPLLNEYEARNRICGQSSTRAYFAIFYGLFLRQYWNNKTFSNDNFEMIFGEFSGTENIDLREMILNLPNNQHISLAYKNSFKWKQNGDPEKTTLFYLNGQEIKDDAGKQGIYHFRYSESGICEYIPMNHGDFF